MKQERFLLKILLLFLVTAPMLFAEEKGGVRISLAFKQAPLRIALNTLAESGNIEIVFNDELVDRHIVTCQFEKVPIEKALAVILDRLPLTFARIADNHYVVEPQRGSISVSGRVVDSKTGDPLPKANIRQKGSDRGVAADDLGFFKFPNLPAAGCTLEVQYIGYISKSIRVSSGTIVTDLTIRLQQTTLAAKPVTVVGKQRSGSDRAHDNLTRYSPSNLALNAWSTTSDRDVFRTAESLPGVGHPTHASSGLFMRGGTPSQTMVLLDGIPIYQRGHAFGLLSPFAGETVQNMRIYQGVLPARYGGRLSGLFELRAKSGDFNRFRLRAASNLLNGRFLAEIPIAGKASWMVSTQRSYSGYIVHGLYDRIFNTEQQVAQQIQSATNSRVEQTGGTTETSSVPNLLFYDVTSKVTFKPGLNDLLFVTVYHGLDRLNGSARVGDFSPPDVLDLHGLSFSGSQTLRQANSLGYSATWNRRWNRHSQFTARYVRSSFHNRHRYQYFFPVFHEDPESPNYLRGASFGSTQTGNQVQESLFSLHQSVTLNQSHSLNFGLQVSRISVREEQKMMSGGLVLEDGSRRTAASQYTFYLQDHWTAGRFGTLFGLRLTSYSRAKQIFSGPRLLLNYSLSDRLSLSAGWGRYHQMFKVVTDDIQQRTNNYFWVLADADDERHLRPGESIHYTLGGRYETSSWRVDAEFYLKNSSGLSEYRLPDLAYLKEFGKSRVLQGDNQSSGVDMSVRLQASDFTGWLSYSYNRSVIGHGRSSALERFPSDEHSPHNIRMVGGQDFGVFKLSFNWRYASGRPFTTPDVETTLGLDGALNVELAPPEMRNNRRLPSDHRLDLSVSRLLHWGLITGEFTLSLLNVYGRKNIWYRYYIVSSGFRAPVDVRTLGFVPMLSMKLRFN